MRPLATSGWRRPAGAILGMLAIAGCGSGSNNGSSNSSGSSGPSVSAVGRQFDNLQFALTSNGSVYAPGVSVPITFTVTNSGAQSVQLDSASCHTFLVNVYQNSRLVWHGEPSGACGGTTSFIAAGEVKTYTLSWPQIDTTVKQVTAGQYTIQAGLTAIRVDGINIFGSQAQNEVASNPITVTVSTP